MADYQQLISEATIIKNETMPQENTAVRVGSALINIINVLKEADKTLTTSDIFEGNKTQEEINREVADKIVDINEDLDLLEQITEDNKKAIESIDNKFISANETGSSKDDGFKASSIIKELYLSIPVIFDKIRVVYGDKSGSNYCTGLVLYNGSVTVLDARKLFSSIQDAKDYYHSCDVFKNGIAHIVFDVEAFNKYKDTNANLIDFVVKTNFDVSDIECSPMIASYLHYDNIASLKKKCSSTSDLLNEVKGVHLKTSVATSKKPELSTSANYVSSSFIPMSNGEKFEYTLFGDAEDLLIGFFGSRDVSTIIQSVAGNAQGKISGTFTATSDGYVVICSHPNNEMKVSFDGNIEEFKKDVDKKIDDAIAGVESNTDDKLETFKEDVDEQLSVVNDVLNKTSPFHFDNTLSESNDKERLTRLAVQEIFITNPLDYKYIRLWYGEYYENDRANLRGYMAGLMLATDNTFTKQWQGWKSFNTKEEAKAYCKSNVPQYWGNGVWAVIDWASLPEDCDGIEWVNVEPNFEIGNIACCPRIASHINYISSIEEKKELDFGLKFFETGKLLSQDEIGGKTCKIITNDAYDNNGVTDFIPMKEGEKLYLNLWLDDIHPYLIFFNSRRFDDIEELKYRPSSQSSWEIEEIYTAPKDGYVMLCTSGIKNKKISISFGNNTVSELKNSIQSATSLALAEKGTAIDPKSNHPEGGYVMAVDGKVFIETVSGGVPETWWSYKIYDVTPKQEFIVTVYRPSNDHIQPYIFLCDDEDNIISTAIEASAISGNKTEMIVVPNGVTKMYIRYYTGYEGNAYTIQNRLDAGGSSNIPAQINKFSNLNMVCRLGYMVYDSSTPPEQSLASYQEAYKRGFRLMLSDVRLTKDGHFVCWHDDLLNEGRAVKNTDGSDLPNKESNPLSISNMTLAEIDRYDFGIFKGEKYAGTKILRLEQFLQFCYRRNLPILIELKVPFTYAKTTEMCNLIKKYKYTDNVAFNVGMEFDHDGHIGDNVIDKISELIPDCTITVSTAFTQFYIKDNPMNGLRPLTDGEHPLNRYQRKFRDGTPDKPVLHPVKNLVVALGKNYKSISNNIDLWGYEYVTDEVYQKALSLNIDFSYSELDTMGNLEDMVNRGFIDKFKFVASRVNIYEYFA